MVTFDNTYKFFFIKSNINYVLVIKPLAYNQIHKLRYSLFGVLVNNVVDTYIGNNVCRVGNNKEIILQDNKIIRISDHINLFPIPKYIVKDSSYIVNNNIGVIDTETYLSDWYTENLCFRV